jgi:hypothetical protein
MTHSKPPRKKPSTTRRESTRRASLDAALEATVQESVRVISELIEDAPTRGASDGERAARGAGATTEDDELRAFEAAATREVAFPADAFVIGEPVEVVSVHYSGHPRAGLTAHCRRDGNVHPVGLADVAFLPGSDGARFVSRYRAWLGLGELPGPIPREAVPVRRHQASGELTIGEPVDLVVLARMTTGLRCRVLGAALELTVRTVVRDEVPGEIVTVVPTKRSTRAKGAYLDGNVRSRRSDVEALGLTPLALHGHGEWNPDKQYWGGEGEPVEEWAKPIIARGKRPIFELEQVLPGADPDPEDYGYDPIIEASELHAAGHRGEAHATLLALLAVDLRCLDAHAHLGNFEFDHRPQQAVRHYEMGVSIGALSLGKQFDGVLPWGLIDNRPFLRCMNGLGLCRWRLGQTREATAVFRKMLWLNPNDNQGARFNLADIEAGRTWEESQEPNQ